MAGLVCLGLAGAQAQVNDTLTGLVTDAASNAPLDSVSVSAEGASAATAPDGRFTLILPDPNSAIVLPERASAHTSMAVGGENITLNGYADHAVISLLDFHGRRIADFASPPGSGAWTVSLRDLPLGIYSATLRTGAGSERFRLAKLPSGPALFRADQASRGAAGKALSKGMATSKPHLVSFVKKGYRRDSLSVPAGTPKAPGITLKMTPDTSGIIPPQALESVQVPAGGASVAFATALAKGELYLLKAAGAVALGDGGLVDAEYGFPAGGNGSDSISGIDVGVDIGRPAIHLAKGAKAGRMKWYGGAKADHAYYLTVTGEGTPLSLKLAKSGTATGGNITVSLIRLSPAPPALGKPLDSMQVPVLRQTVHSALVTQLSRVYLLQAAGSGKVGGGGLGQGDADYMDYNAEGVGQLDVGDANTDYGLAVDEMQTGAPNAYAPRLRWWGTWRKDHTYYMLFTGTGKPIDFTYIDIGYGDNSATDRLTVKVFSLP